MALIVPRHWWSAAIRGSFAIAFGIGAFLLPSLTLAMMVVLYGIFALVDGITALVFAMRGSDRTLPTWAFVLEGVFGIVAGAVALMWPALTLFSLVYVVAFWAIARGVLELGAAVRFHKIRADDWFLAIAGGASVLLGVMMVANPDATILVMSYLIGCYAVVFGISLIAFGIHLRHGNQPAKVPHG